MRIDQYQEDTRDIFTQTGPSFLRISEAEIITDLFLVHGDFSP